LEIRKHSRARAGARRSRIAIAAAAVALLVLGAMWPRGLRAVATCYPDPDDAPASVTEGAGGLAEAFDALDEWQKDRGELRFFTACRRL